MPNQIIFLPSATRPGGAFSQKLTDSFRVIVNWCDLAREGWCFIVLTRNNTSAVLRLKEGVYAQDVLPFVSVLPFGPA